MNRKIKLRVWVEETQTFVYPHEDELVRDRDGFIVGKLFPLFVSDKGLSFRIAKVEGETYKDELGEINEDNMEPFAGRIQYGVGLKDYAHKDMYEGDIVEIESTKDQYVIKWDDDNCKYNLFQVDRQHQADGFNHSSVKYTKMKVIGNIMENALLTNTGKCEHCTCAA